MNIAKRRAEEAGGKEKIRVMMPKEGVGIWVDSFVIPKDAKHVANAHAYINDFLDPEVAAKKRQFCYLCAVQQTGSGADGRRV